MARKELSPRRLKGYYKFSKKYPSRNAESYAIGESRKMKKKEKARKIAFALILCCLFVATFILVSVSMTLSNRPLANNIETESLISVDNLGTIRATYIENTVLGEISDLTKELKKAKKNGCNAVMLDFKTQEGYVTIDGQSDKYYSIDNVIIEKIKSENSFDDTVVIVAHGTFNSYLVLAALGFPYKENFNFSHLNTGVTLVQYLEEDGVIKTKLKYLNDTSHLA